MVMYVYISKILIIYIYIYIYIYNVYAESGAQNRGPCVKLSTRGSKVMSEDLKYGGEKGQSLKLDKLSKMTYVVAHVK